MFYFWAVTGAIGLTLQVLLVGVMLRRQGFREYPFLFAYACVLLATSAVEAEAFLFHRPQVGVQSTYYWAADAVRQTLLYAFVIALWDRVTTRASASKAIRTAMVGGALVYCAISLVMTHEPRFSLWMTRFSRNLGLLAVLLNLLLWASLMVNRRKDKLPLLISGGLGIQMTGKAAGHSLRQISEKLVTVGDLLIVLTHLVCLFFWWQAFRGYTPARYRTESAGTADS